jgi:acetyl-CoA carboxylase carboxyl transferase subunit alpha
MLDYVERLFTEFTELHGDRRFADDKAIVTGYGFFHDEPVFIVGHQKGRDTKQKIFRNFGYAKPEGYRKALRVMRSREVQRPCLSSSTRRRRIRASSPRSAASRKRSR